MKLFTLYTILYTYYFSHFRMPPAKNSLIYSVQDVIATIQNGKNGFEMESDDTDTCDEEAYEDAGEVDKENQHPTACPHSDYVDIEPTKLSQTNKQTMSCDRFAG